MNKYPSVSLYATRNFFVDEESIITGVSGRIRELEKPTKAVDLFLYQTPIQCVAVTVRRAAYEALGGFRLDAGFVVDCEMWARVTSSCGAILSPKVLASYRIGDDTETHRVLRSAQGIKDICHLNALFAQRYASFCVERGRSRVSTMAWKQYLKFKWMGDDVAAANNYAMWTQLTPPTERIARNFDRRVGAHIRRARELGLRGTISRIGNKLSSLKQLQ